MFDPCPLQIRKLHSASLRPLLPNKDSEEKEENDHNPEHDPSEVVDGEERGITQVAASILRVRKRVREIDSEKNERT